MSCYSACLADFQWKDTTPELIETATLLPNSPLKPAVCLEFSHVFRWEGREAMLAEVMAVIPILHYVLWQPLLRELFIYLFWGTCLAEGEGIKVSPMHSGVGWERTWCSDITGEDTLKTVALLFT